MLKLEKLLNPESLNPRSRSCSLPNILMGTTAAMTFAYLAYKWVTATENDTEILNRKSPRSKPA